MVNVHLKNEKLLERGVKILQIATGIDRNSAKRTLKSAGNKVPIALVMLKAGVGRSEAARILKTAKGNVRSAIATARSM
jgi:N-acetylmuramic acid 6-phosphate etherase